MGNEIHKLNPSNVLSYLIVGTTENWESAFRNNPPVWGFTEREQTTWENLKSGDILYLYAAARARGVIGKGLLLNKFIGSAPYWGREIEINVVKWKFRFYIQPLTILPKDLWIANKGPIPSSSFDILGAALQGKQILLLNKEQVKKLEEQMNPWRGIIPRGSTIESSKDEVRETPEKSYDEHTNLIEIVEQMGRLQNFYCEREFSIPNEQRRIDVVWKREVKGTPTYAFEVELSGSLDRAINKLNRCFQLWNTEPRVILPNKDITRTSAIVCNFDTRFQKAVITVDCDRLKQIYEKKREFKNLEREMGLCY